jgi:hypothetical protein
MNSTNQLSGASVTEKSAQLWTYTIFGSESRKKEALSGLDETARREAIDLVMATKKKLLADPDSYYRIRDEFLDKADSFFSRLSGRSCASRLCN